MIRHAVIALVLGSGITTLQAAPDTQVPPDQILFAHFKKVGTALTLDSLRVVPGTLKLPKRFSLQEGDLRVAARSVSGSLLSETAVADPSVKRLEYVNDEGRLQTKVVVKDSVHFTVRVPYTQAVRMLYVTRVTGITGEEEAAQLSEAPLGTFTIQLEESKDE